MNYQLKFLEVYLIYHFEYSCLGLHFLIHSQIDQSSYLLDQLDFWMFVRINYKIQHLLKSKICCNKKLFHFYLLLFFIFIIYRKLGYFFSLLKMLVDSQLFSLFLFFFSYFGTNSFFILSYCVLVLLKVFLNMFSMSIF